MSIDLTLQEAIDQVAAAAEATTFKGYGALEHPSCVLALVVNGEPATQAVAGDSVQLVLDSTPFYGEGGGQVGDRGVLSGDGVIVSIAAVSRNRSVFVHSGQIERGNVAVGDLLTARVDAACRRRAQANHTATHLLQAALKQVVDPGIGQAGSLVDFDRLRFDFHCPRAVTPEELEQIEALINGWISEAHTLVVQEMAIEQAKAAGAVAMFGEKYAEVVRVVDVPGVSMELCGGTHVANTAEIGVFKIISESGVAAGIRRIEAVAGPAVLAYLKEREAVVKPLAERFKAQPGEIVERVAQLAEELKATQKPWRRPAASWRPPRLQPWRPGRKRWGLLPMGRPSSCWWPASMAWRVPACKRRPRGWRTSWARARRWCWAACPIRLISAR